MIICV